MHMYLYMDPAYAPPPPKIRKSVTKKVKKNIFFLDFVEICSMKLCSRDT